MSFPSIAEFDGRKSWSGGGTVRAMTRVATTPANEDFLLTIARYGTASHVEQVLNKYR